MADAPGAGSTGYLNSSPFGNTTAAGGASARPEAADAEGGHRYGDPVQTCAERSSESEPLRPLSIRVSLFFDGTGNNRTNVGLGTEFDDDDSYASGLSNVAKLESAAVERPGPGMDHHLTVYTEGIGTTDRGGDTTWDMADGLGPTGVVPKVARGIAAAVSNIDAIAAQRSIAVLHIDTFGFSRGAAAARLCIWKGMSEAGRTFSDRLAALGYSVSTVVVKFVGLFDTVASFGLAHGNDTADLHLDAISVAEQVVQLAAAEEHRKNFRLTNINSAGARGKQVFLPGVHSDIGGGYAGSEDEVDIQLLDLDVAWLGDAERAAIARERAWVVATGWYLPEQLQETGFFNEVKATRMGISSSYSRIPLKIMADFARENGVFIAATLEDEHPVPRALSAVKDQLLAYATGPTSAIADWFGADTSRQRAWQPMLRNRYLHFSAFYGSTAGANAPQWSNDDPVTGRRQRIVQRG